MSLSNAVKTWLIDPTVQNSSRSEFRLDDAFWVSSIKLADLGVYDAQATTATGLYYPAINGVMASVKKFTVYSGSTIIDEMQELPAWSSIQHLRTSNQGSEDINRFELLNGMNLTLNDDVWTYAGGNKDYVQRYGNSANKRHHNQFQVAALSDNQVSGAVTLSDYLGLLQSNPVLPMIPNLRLVIEWNTTAADYFQDPNATTPVVAPVYAPIRPTLICEELLGMGKQPSDFKLPFLANIVERHVVPAIDTASAAGTQVRSSFRSSAFKNRYVKDLTLFNKVTTDSGWMLAKQRSPVQRGEVIQLIVNGKKYLPDQGINQEAQKLQYFNDTMGSLNLPAPAFFESLTDTSGRVLANADAGTASSTDVIGNYSVTAVRVEDNIELLEIEYTREKSTAATVAEPSFTLLCFGRCAKQLEVKNGVTRLSY